MTPWLAPRALTTSLVGGQAWALPLACLTGMAALWATAGNIPLFLLINGWAAVLPGGLWSGLTVLGDSMAALALLLILSRRRPDIVLAAILAALLAAVVSHLLKEGLGLGRPLAILGQSVHVIGQPLRLGAFPSGHATTAFTLAAVLAAYLPRIGARLALVLAAALIGLSRIAVGAHWPMDVLGGALTGWCCGLAGVWLVERRFHAPPRHLAVLIEAVLVLNTLAMLSVYDSGYPQAALFVRSMAASALGLYAYSWRRPAAT